MNEYSPAAQAEAESMETRIDIISKEFGLSEKERQIARQLYNGKNNYEIAEALSVAETRSNPTITGFIRSWVWKTEFRPSIS